MQSLIVFVGLSVVSCFFVIEDYPDYSLLPSSPQLSSSLQQQLQQQQQQQQQQHAVRQGGGFSITSVEFVGTVFLASLLAFIVLPSIQSYYGGVDAFSLATRRSLPEAANFIMKSIFNNNYETENSISQ